MSANVVTPARICSAAASRVPQRTNSSFTFFASAGKMYLYSQSFSVTSSCSPRNKVIGTCVCPLMNPGSTSRPRASMVCAPLYRPSTSARGPTATIASPFTATLPSRRIFRAPSIVTTIPPLTMRSTSCFVCPNIAELSRTATDNAARIISTFSLRIRGCPHPSLAALWRDWDGDFDFTISSCDSYSRYSLQIKLEKILRIRSQTNLRVRRARFLSREPFLVHANVHPLHRTQIRTQHKYKGHRIKQRRRLLSPQVIQHRELIGHGRPLAEQKRPLHFVHFQLRRIDRHHKQRNPRRK